LDSIDFINTTYHWRKLGHLKRYNFFVSKKEASGKIVNTDIQSSGYRIRVSYFNKYKGINVTTTVKIKNSYKKFIQNFEKLSQFIIQNFFQNMFM
jgi:hypothetical protein